MYDGPRRSSSPLCTHVHAQRVRASRGPYAAREEQGKELTRAAALRESRPCTREAQPHCTSRRGRDAEADAPSIIPLRRRADSVTAARRWTAERPAVKV